MPAPKLQRWMDLLAALLRRHYPVSFEDLIADVPAYQQGGRESVRRKFERDKDELRAFGIPIQTVRDGEGDVVGYQLGAKDFYLPYLHVVLAGRRTAPRRVGREGYRALAELSFEPDELAAVVEAARRVELLGDPLPAEAARSALRKLAVDLPLDAVAPPAAESVIPGRTRVEPAVFEALDDALTRRKRVGFTYHSMTADTRTRRTVEPLGLFFLGQHWYLAAREEGEHSVKNFRLDRISAPEVNPASPGTADFAPPAGFRLREHARSRQAWELGDGDALEVQVEFHGGTGAVLAAARLGEPVEGSASRRRFRVRRLDAFVRWLLSLGDRVTPLAPEPLLREHARQVAATLALYGGPGGRSTTAAAP